MNQILALRVFITSLALLAFSSASAAEKLRPIAHEDVWLAKRVGTPAVSPDGQWAAVSVIDPAYDEKDQSSDLWLVATNGKTPPRQITFTKGAESGLAWSTDGTKLAFSTKREGDEFEQIYILEAMVGGEARRVTTLSTGARLPRWSRDGKTLLFISTVYPGAADDEANKKAAAAREARKAKVRVFESFPVRYWDKWLDDLQPHVFVQNLETGTGPRDLLAGTALVKNPGFAGRESETSEELDAVWAPDGQSVIFSATAERNRSAYAQVSSHLFQVSLTGGEPKRIIEDDDSYGRPEFTPDGRYLIATVTSKNGEIYNNARMISFDWPGVGKRKVISAEVDVSVVRYAVGPDSETVYFSAEEQGYEKLFRASVSGQGSSGLFAQKAGVYNGISVGGTAEAPVLVAEYDTGITAPELVRVNLQTALPEPLTHFNTTRLAGVDLTAFREFWFTAKNGRRIHNYIVLPPGYDPARKYPLFSWIHGGAANMNRDSFFLRWNYNLLAAPGYIVLMTNYTGSTGFGEKFAQAIKGDPLKGPGDELIEAIDEAIRLYPSIDRDRLAAGGASYGGHLANWLEGHSDRFKCLIAHSGLVNLEAQWGTSDTIYGRELNAGGPPWAQGTVWREQNPIRAAGDFKTPILLSVGENDFRVPINNTLENWSALQRMKVPSKLLVFPDENHWIRNGENNRFMISEATGWLGKWLK